MSTTACERCGHPIEPGEWPFCPHGKTRTLYIERDEIPGGQTFENYGPQPVTFYSHSERRAYMKQHGLVEREKFAPMPGTDIDPAGIPNPKGYMDPYTLESARILLSRGSRVEAEPEVPMTPIGGVGSIEDVRILRQEEGIV